MRWAIYCGNGEVFYGETEQDAWNVNLKLEHLSVQICKQEADNEYGFTIGCLDDPTPYQATEHQGVKSQLANVKIIDDLPCSRVDDDPQIKPARALET